MSKVPSELLLVLGLPFAVKVTVVFGNEVDVDLKVGLLCVYGSIGISCLYSYL